MSKGKITAVTQSAEGTGLGVSMLNQEDSKDRWAKILGDSDLGSSIGIDESQKKKAIPAIADFFVKKANSAEGLLEILSLFSKKP